MSGRDVATSFPRNPCGRRRDTCKQPLSPWPASHPLAFHRPRKVCSAEDHLEFVCRAKRERLWLRTTCNEWQDGVGLTVEIKAVELSGEAHEFRHLGLSIHCWGTSSFTNLPGRLEAEAERGASKCAVPNIAGGKCTQREEGHFRFRQTQRRAVAFHPIAILGQTVGIALEGVHRRFRSRSRSCERQAHFRGGQKMSFSTAQEHFKEPQRVAPSSNVSIGRNRLTSQQAATAFSSNETRFGR